MFGLELVDGEVHPTTVKSFEKGVIVRRETREEMMMVEGHLIEIDTGLRMSGSKRVNPKC